MCGIFGIVQVAPLNAQDLRSMSHLLRHRGPDDEGFLVAKGRHVDLYGGQDTPEAVYATKSPYQPLGALPEDLGSEQGCLVLGHRRLSIIDLSPAGHQPMSYLDRYWLVYNGEIYNYLELQEELRGSRYVFQSHSDSEVILAAYDKWGPDCVHRFNGMWSIAIFDRLKQTLFLTRDRFGVKPLYLWTTPGRLAFASEIKAFTGLQGWKAVGNLPRILDYAVWGCTDLGKETLFKGVFQFPAGHRVLVRIADLIKGIARQEPFEFRSERWYWPAECTFASEAEAVRALRDLFVDAVRLRLRADVAVGSCLSGGLDSSSIVSVMQSLLDQSGVSGKQQTFTASSSEAPFDETRFAQAVVDHTGVRSNFTTPELGRLFKDLESLVWAQDEPFASTSIFAQWCVFHLARERNVSVMLDGQGADEILCGYRGFIGAHLAELFRGGKMWLLVKEISALRREIGFSPARSVGYMLSYLAPRILRLLGRFDDRAFSEKDWIGPDHRDAFDRNPIVEAGGRPSSVRAMSLAQLEATNLPMLLRWEDRNSMACSIEARTPFLDYRLVEACLGMSSQYKIGGGVTKGVLRKAMRGLVPDIVLDRRDKMGFVTAENVWVKQSPEPFRLAIQMAFDRFPGLYDASLLEKFDEVVAGKKAFDHRYWRAINLGYWARAFDVSTRLADGKA